MSQAFQKPYPTTLVPRRKTIMIPLLLDISGAFRGGLVCDNFSEVQEKGSHGPQHEKHPSVYGQQAAPGYIPFCWNKSFLTRTPANSTYFMPFNATEKSQ